MIGIIILFLLFYVIKRKRRRNYKVKIRELRCKGYPNEEQFENLRKSKKKKHFNSRLL